MNVFRRDDAPPGRHRAIETRIWDLIRPLGSDATRLFLYLWIGPQSNPQGILRFPEGYALTDLNWTPECLAQAWTELEAADLVWRDGELVVIVPFLQSNAPVNENIIKGWTKALASLPDSPLFGQLYQKATAWLKPEGLTWLQAKGRSAPPSIQPTPNSFETVSKHRVQRAVLREQLSESREQGAGESRGEEPAGALRSASPLEAASLRAPGLEADPAGEPKAAWEGKNREQPETAPKDPTGPGTLSSLPPLPVPPVDGAAKRRTRLRELLAPRPGQDVSYYVLLARKAGYPKGEIRSVLAELSGEAPPGVIPAESPQRPVLLSPVAAIKGGPRRLCAGSKRDGTECVVRSIPGSEHCVWHQPKEKATCASVA